MPTIEEMKDSLRDVYDPDLGISIIDLGLVYDVRLKEDKFAEIDMTLTSPACPYGPMLISETQQAVMKFDGIEDVKVELVWDPPWGPDRMSEAARLELNLD